MVGNGFLAELVARLRITYFPVHCRSVLKLESMLKMAAKSYPQSLYF